MGNRQSVLRSMASKVAHNPFGLNRLLKRHFHPIGGSQTQGDSKPRSLRSNERYGILVIV